MFQKLACRLQEMAEESRMIDDGTRSEIGRELQRSYAMLLMALLASAMLSASILGCAGSQELSKWIFYVSAITLGLMSIGFGLPAAFRLKLPSKGENAITIAQCICLGLMYGTMSWPGPGAAPMAAAGLLLFLPATGTGYAIRLNSRIITWGLAIIISIDVCMLAAMPAFHDSIIWHMAFSLIIAAEAVFLFVILLRNAVAAKIARNIREGEARWRELALMLESGMMYAIFFFATAMDMAFRLKA